MKSIDRIVIRSDVANWPLPGFWPTGMGIGTAVMAVPVATVTDRTYLGQLLLVPILLAVVYQTLVIARQLWYNWYSYLLQRWLDGARNVLDDTLIDDAVIGLSDVPPCGQDRVLRRIQMSDAGGRWNGSSSASPIA